MTVILSILYALLLLFIGALIGCVLPGFVQLWRISQFSYKAGFSAGHYVVGAHIRKALGALVRGDVATARAELEKAERVH